jgi:catechol 2,3-dioxygenase-like lactoylglutathione lyase family enzyme
MQGIDFDGRKIFIGGRCTVEYEIHLTEMSNIAIDAGVRMGHVHLKVADLERALGFYCGVLGFELMQRFGDSAAFVSARWLPSPHRAEYMAEQGREGSGAGEHRAISPSDRLPDTSGAGRRFAAADARRSAT